MLFGREEACGQVDAMLSSLRERRGDGVLVLGPAGMGKTALLQYAADGAQGLQVVRARGAPTEMAIPFSGLSQVLTPLLPFMPCLSAPQAEAVAGALTIGPAVPGADLPLLAGTLRLLAAAAEQTPLLVLVDDLNWLDTASRDALQFAQRRLERDAVLFVLAYRLDPEQDPPPPGIRTLRLEGLDAEPAATLLEAQGYRVSPALVRWLVHATGGNPLALRDLPAYVTPERIADFALRSQPPPVGPLLTAAYGAAVTGLPPEAQQAVLIAALLDDLDLHVVTRALASCGLSTAALEPGEDAGLLTLLGGVVRMRHPLVRAAMISTANPSALRAAHRAAAEGLQASTRAHHHEARVWHLADAALDLDQPTAQLLEDLADAAKARAGFAAASLTYEKAADLTPLGHARARRRLAAAEAALTAGLGRTCRTLLEQATEEGADTAPSSVCQAGLVRGRLETWSGNPSDAARDLEVHAERAARSDPGLSMQLSAEATVAALLSGDMTHAFQAAQSVRRIAQQLGSVALPYADLLVGAVQALRGDGNGAREFLDRSRIAFDIGDPPLSLLQQLVHLATAYSFIDGFEEAVPLFRRAIAMARDYGAIGLLPFALTQKAVVDFRLGNWDVASVAASEALRLAEDCGRTTERPNILVVLAMIDAARGREEARARALAAVAEASVMGTAVIEAQGNSMLGLLELSIGRPAAALGPLIRCRAIATTLGLLELGHLQWAAELVEAGVRSGRPADTAPTMDIMREATHPSAISLNRALLARCEGLIAVDGAGEHEFRTALELHQESVARPFEVARTELCFGERLRRQRRRKEARVHLGAAWEKFSGLGAVTWAQTASRELQATGTTMPGPTVHLSDLLTPQELQVALAVAAGGTNRQVADALFLSQKTVEFHLSGVYRRLGLRSRGDLSRVLANRRPSPVRG